MSEASPIRVMLVDDHAVVRSGLGAFLMAFDNLELVGEAGGGEEAVRLCVQVKPDVVLMDLVMPGMDGPTATRVIRERCPEIQVIALTSFKEEELVQRALEAGAIGYLLKNVSAGELVDAIRAAHAGRPTLAPEAAQVLIQATRATGEPRPPGHDLPPPRARGVGSDGQGVEQSADRRTAGRQSVHRQVSRQQHPFQAGGLRPHRGGGPGGAAQPGHLTRQKTVPLSGR